MTVEKTLTVAIPAYNVENYLPHLLQSLLDCHERDYIEIIIVNDGSKDNTLVISQKFQKQYPDIIRIINKANGGHGSAINCGLTAATGLYFCVIDGDDYVVSTEMDKLLQILKASNADLVLTNTILFDNERKTTKPKPHFNLENGHIYNLEEMQNINKIFGLSDSHYKTNLLKNNIGTISEKTFYVDYEYDSYPLCFINTIVYYNISVYVYRVNNNNQSISFDNIGKNYNHYLTVCNALLNNYKHNYLNGVRKQLYIRNCSEIISALYLSTLAYSKNKKATRKIAKNFKNYLNENFADIYQVTVNNYYKFYLIGLFPRKVYIAFKEAFHRV